LQQSLTDYMKERLFLTTACVLACVAGVQAQTLKRNSELEVAKGMTVEEKAAMVCGIGGANWQVPTMTVAGAAGTTSEFDRYGITKAVMTDGPAGVHINVDQFGTPQYTTAFPVNTAMAATWDVDMIDAVGAAVGEEVKDLNMDVILAPSMNIQRNPLCGRNFEYYSEDPLLSGKCGAAYIRGVQSQGVSTSMKHFAGNQQETNRQGVDNIISQRALREIYLRGFEIAVREGHPWTVMTSYNRINGRYTSENPELLKDVLRGDWNYPGMVMTDWSGGKDPIAQMKAGNDLLMPGNWQDSVIAKAVNVNRTLDEETLNENVSNILKFIKRTPRYKEYQPTLSPDLAAHRSLVRKAGAESMVLLKNSKMALPLAARKKVALFGKGSYCTAGSGTGSGFVNTEHTVALDEGLGKAGYKVDAALKAVYDKYIAKAFADWKETEWYFPKETAAIYATEMNLDNAAIRKAAANDDIAVITLQRCSGEGWDRSVNDYFELSDAERSLISSVSSAFHAAKKKVAVVLNISGVIETASWKDKADAILVSWLPGEEAGNSIADVLSGKTSPCGRLPMTWPVKYADEPSAADFPGEPKENPVTDVYKEGIYTGYRYFATAGVPVSYKFGYGLSYATFYFNNLWIDSKFFPDGGKITVSFSVTNTGKVASRDVCQLYITAPNGSIDKPAYELKAFVKTRVLKPGEFQNFSIEIDPKLIASYWSGPHAWVADAGQYKVMVGDSPENLPLSDTFTVRKDMVVETTSDVLYPTQYFDELHLGSAAVVGERGAIGILGVAR